MGFDETHSRAALYHFHGDIERCVEELIRMGGIVPHVWVEETPTTSSESTSSSKSPEEKAQEKEAIAMIVPDLHQGEEDHLDLDLIEEAQWLQEYISLVASLH
ncbi:hypothetical protein LSH36_1064g00050 [Paralvinella palmiformis]|nr:hypothetical protein LSH36_1064g00050 [Paralvinella palmiformis]